MLRTWQVSSRRPRKITQYRRRHHCPQEEGTSRGAQDTVGVRGSNRSSSRQPKRSPSDSAFPRTFSHFTQRSEPHVLTHPPGCSAPVTPPYYGTTAPIRIVCVHSHTPFETPGGWRSSPVVGCRPSMMLCRRCQRKYTC